MCCPKASESVCRPLITSRAAFVCALVISVHMMISCTKFELDLSSAPATGTCEGSAGECATCSDTGTHWIAVDAKPEAAETSLECILSTRSSDSKRCASVGERHTLSAEEADGSTTSSMTLRFRGISDTFDDIDEAVLESAEDLSNLHTGPCRVVHQWTDAEGKPHEEAPQKSASGGCFIETGDEGRILLTVKGHPGESHTVTIGYLKREGQGEIKMERFIPRRGASATIVIPAPDAPPEEEASPSEPDTYGSACEALAKSRFRVTFRNGAQNPSYHEPGECDYHCMFYQNPCSNCAGFNGTFELTTPVSVKNEGGRVTTVYQSTQSVDPKCPSWGYPTTFFNGGAQEHGKTLHVELTTSYAPPYCGIGVTWRAHWRTDGTTPTIEDPEITPFGRATLSFQTSGRFAIAKETDDFLLGGFDGWTAGIRPDHLNDATNPRAFHVFPWPAGLVGSVAPDDINFVDDSGVCHFPGDSRETAPVIIEPLDFNWDKWVQQ